MLYHDEVNSDIILVWASLAFKVESPRQRVDLIEISGPEVGSVGWRGVILIQCDQLYIALCFWYLAKNHKRLAKCTHVNRNVHWTSHLFFCGNTRPCLSGQVVYVGFLVFEH